MSYNNQAESSPVSSGDQLLVKHGAEHTRESFRLLQFPVKTGLLWRNDEVGSGDEQRSSPNEPLHGCLKLFRCFSGVSISQTSQLVGECLIDGDKQEQCPPWFLQQLVPKTFPFISLGLPIASSSSSFSFTNIELSLDSTLPFGVLGFPPSFSWGWLTLSGRYLPGAWS